MSLPAAGSWFAGGGASEPSLSPQALQAPEAVAREAVLVAKGRVAHPGTSLDEAIQRGIGTERDIREIADVPVDGRRLGEFTDALRTPDRFEVRPANDYAEAFAIARVVVRARLRGATISLFDENGAKRERPDALIVHGDSEIGAEVVRVMPEAKAFAKTVEVQKALLHDVRANAALQPRGDVVTFRLPAAGAVALDDAQQRALADEFSRFLEHYVRTGSTLSFEPGSLASTTGVMTEITPSGTSGYGVQVLPAQVSSDELLEPILGEIEKKRRVALEPGFDRSRPLWLIVDVSDQRGTFDASLGALPERADVSPFERVAVVNGHGIAQILDYRARI